jgi:hypothetical protein
MAEMPTSAFQPKTVSIPLQDFQAITASVTEHEKRSSERVQFETAFHQRRQTVDCLAHICAPTRQVNLFTRPLHYWHKPFNTLQMSVNAALSKSDGTLTVYVLPTRTSIEGVFGFIIDAENSLLFTSTQSTDCALGVWCFAP